MNLLKYSGKLSNFETGGYRVSENADVCVQLRRLYFGAGTLGLELGIAEKEILGIIDACGRSYWNSNGNHLFLIHE